MNDFRSLVLKNRSYRGFAEARKITKNELLELVDLARLTPSARNSQPLKFYLSYTQEETEKILAVTKWGGALPELNLPFDHSHPTAFIIILEDESIEPHNNFHYVEVGIKAQTILLGAVEKELGGLIISAFNANKLKEILNLPANLNPLQVIALGRPTEKISLVPMDETGNTKYYRDAENHHYVPKRALKDITITAEDI